MFKAVDRARLDEDGFAFSGGAALREHYGISDDEWAAFLVNWDDLGPDDYLGTDYMFRLRRFGRLDFCPADGTLRPLEDSTFLQSKDLNRHAGGVVRSFEPIDASVLTSRPLGAVLRGAFEAFDVPAEFRERTWRIDVNFFRIRTEGPNSYSPTPEGIHRDGYPFGVISVVGRRNIQGGISHVYSLDEEFVAARLLGEESLDSLFAYDTRVKHYTTPVYSCDGREGHRDLLGFVYYLPGSHLDREH
ncbi:MAG TPA: 2OG-Fe dioxygenase family protein [Kineosporiaceae bacterium]|jgi:hypothetical protein|nr:2OG-Fe dioxygenase family protein [Kineosporiaceae bacterium]